MLTAKISANSKTETFAFWSHFLKETGIVWTDKTQNLIQTILVLPIGSAEAERGFSTLNHIKNKRRSKLTAAHMQDIMRIRLNGTNKLEEFPASKYAKFFIDENHIRTDDPRWQTKSVSTLRLLPMQLKKKICQKFHFYSSIKIE